MKFLAKKIIEDKTEGEYQHVTYHVVKIDLDTEKINLILDDNLDDWESAWSNGIAYDADDDLSFIDIESFLDHCDDELIDQEEDIIESRGYKYFIDKLNWLRGYTLHPTGEL